MPGKIADAISAQPTAGPLNKITQKTSDGEKGAFGDMLQAVQDIKGQGANYEKAVTGQGKTDEDWVTALAQLQTDLQVVKRLSDEFLALAKEVSHFQV